MRTAAAGAVAGAAAGPKDIVDSIVEAGGAAMLPVARGACL